MSTTRPVSVWRDEDPIAGRIRILGADGIVLADLEITKELLEDDGGDYMLPPVDESEATS